VKKLEFLLVGLILLFAFSARLYRINNPIADWHSWRQADTAAVARNFVKDHFNPLYPQSDSFLALNEYGLQNPNRYFINEFPLYNSIVALLYMQFGINTQIARLVSIFFATVGTLFLYLIAKKLFNFKVAIISTLFYALNPYNIYYGRVIMPDPAFISFSIASIYFCLKWVDTKKLSQAILLTIFFALAMLVKPYAIFLAIPIFYWLFVNWGKKLLQSPQTYIVLIGSFVPLVLWRLHVHFHPEGTFATSWLFNGNNIRFSGAFFRWLIFERLNKLIFAAGGFVLLFFGLSKSHQSKNGLFIFIWFLSVILYMTVFAMGNVTHDYYQLPVMPVGSILVGLGFFTLVNFAKSYYGKVINFFLAVGLIGISLAFGWYQARDFFNINRPAIVEAGKKVDEILPKDALVIAPYQGDPAFLYQTNRHGYPVVNQPLESYIDQGIKYLVSVEVDDMGIKNLKSHCNVLAQSQDYVILELFKECIGK